ncbi:MAG: DUF441 domain-containing protein [Pelotomaculum sp.]|nr:DUF441 domain-containing protein [Pelotomaculum sp.]
MSGVNMLVVLLLIGMAAHSSLIVIAACILLILKLTNVNFIFSLLERRGLEMGLTFLLLSILVPLASGKASWQEIISSLASFSGLLAVAGGALATSLNTRGLNLLKADPEIVFGLLLGSILGIVFLHGIPVGPLMAAGITALLMQLARIFKP